MEREAEGNLFESFSGNQFRSKEARMPEQRNARGDLVASRMINKRSVELPLKGGRQQSERKRMQSGGGSLRKGSAAWESKEHSHLRCLVRSLILERLSFGVLL